MYAVNQCSNPRNAFTRNYIYSLSLINNWLLYLFHGDCVTRANHIVEDLTV